MPTRAPFISDTVPLSGSICPAMMRKSVDFPLPFTPTSPIRDPAASERFTSLKTSFITKLLLMFWRVNSIIFQSSS